MWWFSLATTSFTLALADLLNHDSYKCRRYKRRCSSICAGLNVPKYSEWSSNSLVLEASRTSSRHFVIAALCLCDFWLPDQSSRAPDPRSSQFTTALHCWASQASNERKLCVCAHVCVSSMCTLLKDIELSVACLFVCGYFCLCMFA